MNPHQLIRLPVMAVLVLFVLTLLKLAFCGRLLKQPSGRTGLPIEALPKTGGRGKGVCSGIHRLKEGFQKSAHEVHGDLEPVISAR